MSKIQGILDQKTKELLQAPFLRTIRNCTKEQYTQFIIQRFLAAQYFEELLQAGIKSTNNQDLKQVLQENLNDEQGVDSNGKTLRIGSHSEWRDCFLKELGISDLGENGELEGTLFSNEVTRELIDQENPNVIAGAILFLEYSIPFEFEVLKKARNQLFPDISSKGRMYLNHHIAHDAHDHFPKLMNIIRQLDQEEVIRGIEIMSKARIGFYKNLRF